MRIADTNDLFGRFFLKKCGTAGRDGYYESLLYLEPMLRSPEWEATAGYYINIGKKDSVRLSYFVEPGKDVTGLVDHFISRMGLEHAAAEPVRREMVSEQYGCEELRFRRFLSTYALIGLDIMTTDLLHARCLFATFRFQIMLPRRPYRPHFESTFSKQSAHYQFLGADERDQFWEDMSHWPNPPQVDWAHTFMNMVIGGDWQPSPFLQPQPALSIAHINRILRNCRMGFQIPVGWDS